jgi:Transcriptional regulator
MKENSEKMTKRDSILDAAFTLFMKKGYWDTKIIDIADAAGIGKGTIYEYFESKDAILLELYQSKFENCYQDLNVLLDRDISSTEKLEEYVRFDLINTQKFGFSKNILMDMLMKSDAFQNRTLIDSIHKLIGFKVSILYQIIEEGIRLGEFSKVDPLMAATSIMGAVNSFISFGCCLVNPELYLPKEKLKPWSEDEFLYMIFNGIKL